MALAWNDAFDGDVVEVKGDDEVLILLVYYNVVEMGANAMKYIS